MPRRSYQRVCHEHVGLLPLTFWIRSIVVWLRDRCRLLHPLQCRRAVVSYFLGVSLELSAARHRSSVLCCGGASWVRWLQGGVCGRHPRDAASRRLGEASWPLRAVSSSRPKASGSCTLEVETGVVCFCLANLILALSLLYYVCM